MKAKIKKKEKLKEKLYVVLTDKGYLIGDIYIGVAFTNNKENARKFTETEAIIYKNSIADDLFDFYLCKTMEFEKL